MKFNLDAQRKEAKKAERAQEELGETGETGETGATGETSNKHLKPHIQKKKHLTFFRIRQVV